MQNYITIFNTCRKYLLKRLEEKIEVYLCDIWDPLCKYILIKETNKIIENELHNRFPQLPKIYLPKCKFRIDNESQTLEVGVQEFLNIDPKMYFLGNISIGDEPFDLYCRESFDPRFDYTFIAKYGHNETDCYTGSKSAAAEYMLGKYTPLAIAYGYAVEEGFIS